MGAMRVVGVSAIKGGIGVLVIIGIEEDVGTGVEVGVGLG